MLQPNLSFNSSDQVKYDDLLIKNSDDVHRALQDILSCKIDDIRRTKVQDMEQILKLFPGKTLTKQKEELIEFLNIMPEYRTTDQQVLYQRLKTLKDQLKRTGGVSNLCIWALYTQQRFLSRNESENEGQE